VVQDQPILSLEAQLRMPVVVVVVVGPGPILAGTLEQAVLVVVALVLLDIVQA
jgi:uncharacterized membrane protein